MRINFAHKLREPSYRAKANMLQFENAPKRATNVSLNSKALDTARGLGMNISQALDSFLIDEVKRRYWESWNERNKDAVNAYNDRVATHGLPMAKYRTYAKSLGDGKHNATAKAHDGEV